MGQSDGMYQQINNIHQVLIIDGLGLPERLSRRIKTNRDHALDLYPGATYKLWSGSDLREFIEAEIGLEALEAFDTLKPYSYKCDLARYCLLWARGGIYFDLAIQMVNRWNIPVEFQIAAFTETYDGMDSWTATQTSLLWSKPGRAEWKYAIDAIISNCRNRYYGPHDHYPTAGALLGRSFARSLVDTIDNAGEDEQWMGECRYVTPERQMQNVCYVAPDKRIVGMRTKLSAGDLAELELTGTNNYTKLFRSRQIYGESIRFWSFNDPRIVVDHHARKTESGLSYRQGHAGRMCYGPFVDLDPGMYQVNVEFSERTNPQKILVDVSSDYGRHVIIDRQIEVFAIHGKRSAEFAFSLDVTRDAIEFRFSVDENFRGDLLSISLSDGVSLHWSATDPEIQAFEPKCDIGVPIKMGQVGRVSFGPYVTLRKGMYELFTHVSGHDAASSLAVEICSGVGDKSIDAVRLPVISSNGRVTLVQGFSITQSEPDVEFRVETSGSFEGHLLGFSLHRTGEIVT